MYSLIAFNIISIAIWEGNQAKPT